MSRCLMYRGVDMMATVTGPIAKITKATCSHRTRCWEKDMGRV